MKSICDRVAERVALGEPLGEDADHAASCARCRRLVALPALLGEMKREADPGIGFSSRLTANVQHRLTVRRRWRIGGTIAFGTAAAAFLAFALFHRAGDESLAVTPPVPAPNKQAVEPPHHDKKDPWVKRDVDDDVRALVHLANVERSSHLSANWGRIEKSLAPYRAVLKGNQP